MTKEQKKVYKLLTKRKLAKSTDQARHDDLIKRMQKLSTDENKKQPVEDVIAMLRLEYNCLQKKEELNLDEKSRFDSYKL